MGGAAIVHNSEAYTVYANDSVMTTIRNHGGNNKVKIAGRI